MAIKKINYSEIQGLNQIITLSSGTLVLENLTLKVHDGVTPGGLKVSDYVLPAASINSLGGIKVGENLTIDNNGVLSASSATLITVDQGYLLSTISTTSSLVGNVGMTQVVNSYSDNATVEISLPFDVSFCGSAYNRLYVTSNSMVFFENATGYDFSLPLQEPEINISAALAKWPTPAIYVDGGDRSWNALYTTSTENTFRIRFEGCSTASGGLTDLVWELTLDNTSTQYQLSIGDNGRLTGTQVSAITDGTALLGSFSGDANTGYIFNLSSNIKTGRSLKFVGATTAYNYAADRIDVSLSSELAVNTSYIKIGYKAGESNVSTSTVAIGKLAGRFGDNRGTVAIGEEAASFNQADFAVAIGTHAGWEDQGNNSVAVGLDSGYTLQRENAIAIGHGSGFSVQSTASIAIGYDAGHQNQQEQAVAIGWEAGYNQQKKNAIAIGHRAGGDGQGTNSIAIGEYAGWQYQQDNSIILNASGSTLTCAAPGFYVKPVREKFWAVSENPVEGIKYHTVYFNTTTQEITYGPVPGTTNANTGLITFVNDTLIGNIIPATGAQYSFTTDKFENTFNTAGTTSSFTFSTATTATFVEIGDIINFGDGTVRTATNAHVVMEDFIIEFDSVTYTGTPALFPILIETPDYAPEQAAKVELQAGTSTWVFSNTGTLVFPNGTTQSIAYEIVSPPASSTSTGVAGNIAYNESYFYACTATNAWQRISWDSTPW